MNIKFNKRIVVFFCVILFSCKPGIDIPTPQSGSADFSRTVYIGGSYLAGYQDGALSKDGQKKSIPVLLSGGFLLTGGKSPVTAWMPEGISVGLTFKANPFRTKYKLANHTDCLNATSLFPESDFVAVSIALTYFQNTTSTFDNFSIPFASVKDFFNPAFGASYMAGNSNPYYYRMASNPGTSTVFSELKNRNATFVVIWTGMEDIYNYAQLGGDCPPIPSASQFSVYLDSLLSAMKKTGAKGVLANIPDISSFPYYTLIPSIGITLDKNKADSLNNSLQGAFTYHEGKNGFQIEDTTLPFPYRLSREGEYILLNTPLDSVRCHKMGLFFPLPGRYILDSTEITTINRAVREYNNVLYHKAYEYGFAFANINSYFNSVKSGIKLNGVSFDLNFVSGGFFSLDGFHPNQKGYAMLASVFIEAINMKYESSLPPVYCQDCTGVQFP